MTAEVRYRLSPLAKEDREQSLARHYYQVADELQVTEKALRRVRQVADRHICDTWAREILNVLDELSAELAAAHDGA